MAKRSGSALERGAKKAARASSKLVEINYDGEWYMGEILKEAGADFKDVVKTTILLADMADFKTVNEIYGKRFPENPPARATFAVKTLPLDALVEIDCTAYLP